MRLRGFRNFKNNIEMKLEIKHLSAYLPYELKFEQMGGKNYTLMPSNISCFDYQFGKPLLRPLSQLTQEIEHNEEKFVPMIEIVKMIEPYYVEIDESTSDFNVINKCIGKDRVYQLRYKNNYNNQGEISMLNFHENEKCLWHSDRIIPIKCHDKLFEWHFDIFGLIENNLAIEKL
jgi:hypothetical protein